MIITEQRILTPGPLTPGQLAAEVQRLTSSPAEWVARVRLDPEGRWYERIQMTDDSGDGFLLSLQRAVRLSDGDGLELTQGGYLRIVAGPEPLVEAPAQDAQQLARRPAGA